MAEPYVQFVINHVTKVLHEDALSFVPDPAMPTHPYDWKVVCDAASRVVVRARGVVIATALWQYGRTQDQQTQAGSPDAAGWELIDEQLRRFVEQSRATRAPDPDALDRGVIEPRAPSPQQQIAAQPASVMPLEPSPPLQPRPVVAQPRQPLFKRIWHWIVVAVTVIGFGIGLAWKLLVGVPNGRDCTIDSECSSHNCFHSRICQPKGYGDHNFINGSSCDYSSECKSDNCYRHTCYGR